MKNVLAMAMVAVLVFHRYRRDSGDESLVRSVPRASLSVGVGRAGMFFSGAMRCPKCRADMDLLEVEGVQVDRCSECHGLWFDAGEVEALRDRQIATALDTGDAVTGKTHNSVDNYRCPRCGGGMLRMVDPQQTHIWYETCPDGHGAYFDAGEFTDLRHDTLMDRVRDFLAGKRDA